MGITLYLDTPSNEYYRDVLFDENNGHYNRDNCLAPYIAVKKRLSAENIGVHTADYLFEGKYLGDKNVYISLGNIKNLGKLKSIDVIKSSFYLFEPPVVSDLPYRNIKSIANGFKRVYLHTIGPGLAKYTDGIVNIKKLFWPQVEDGIISSFWNQSGRKFITLINANKKPSINSGELYSERLSAIRHFSENSGFDLYGYGWDKFIYYIPYIISRKAIKKSYRGKTASKYGTLGNYKFAVCFENMALEGYLTEKIFDCIFTGTIPVYLGAPDIIKYVPRECFIDKREYSSYADLEKYLYSLNNMDINRYKNNGREYLESGMFRPFTKSHFAESLKNTVYEDIGR